MARNILTDKVYDTTFNKAFDYQLNIVNEQEQLGMEQAYFTKPIISFLKMINNFDAFLNEKNTDRFSDLAEIVEKDMINGLIEISKTFSNSIAYKPSGSDNYVKMHVASSVVTEIAPLYLVLKYNYPMNRLMMEEPEMCMHPKFQLILARVLTRLINKGVPVWITTHSDIIIQHINNMIRLNPKEDNDLMEKYGYDETDVLTLNQVSIYQFQCDGEHTSVEQLKGTLGGFNTTTFSDAFEDIVSQTYDIQEG